jgi:hypothetical protein
MPQRANKLRNICEVLREINDLHQGRSAKDKETRRKIAEAEHMAKRMAMELSKHDPLWEKDWWEKNPDYKEDLARRSSASYIFEEHTKNHENT